MAGIVEQQFCEQVGRTYCGTTVRWDHWGEGFLPDLRQTVARSMIGGCSPGRISFLYFHLADYRSGLLSR